MQSSLYGNQGRPNGGSARPARTNTAEVEDQLHRENEAMLNALGTSVSSMKTMAGSLNQGAQEQNEFLKGIGDVFTTARRGVGSATTGLSGVMNRYGWRHTLGFACVAFLAIYLLFRAVTWK